MTTASALTNDRLRLGLRTPNPRRSPIIDELDCIAGSGDFVAGLRRSAHAADAAERSDRPDLLVADLAAFAQRDDYAALLALESLAAVGHASADALLTDLLSHPGRAVRRHAAWRLGVRRPNHRAIEPLVAQTELGGADTLHAMRTLRRWSVTTPEPIAQATRTAIATAIDPVIRARLVDLLGSLAGAGSPDVLMRLAADRGEAIPARVAAIGALGESVDERVGVLLRRLAVDDDEVGAHAALALEHHESTPSTSTHHDGARIAQLVLAGGLDGQLSLGGRGETGGVASLLVSLGEALAGREDVEHVLTIGRGAVSDALMSPPFTARGIPSYGTIAIGSEGRRASTPDEVWEHLPTIEREVKRILGAAGRIDMLHLRMADAGTLAGAEIAATLGIPICFSVAPDPHNVIQSLQSRGELDRDSFVELDTNALVWFRARLVERLARTADRLALFPRAEPTALLADLGLDVEAEEHRVAVVAEGIDIGQLRRAEARRDEYSTTDEWHDDVVAELARLIPTHRRGLPLLLSVGRLHPVKGMERIATAWAGDPRLHETCNLVIVGGDLEDPSTTERAVLDAIEAAIPLGDPRRDGLVMLGGRPHRDVAQLLVTTASGVPGRWSDGGVYVDGALKEEFGLALIEALAAGLVVTAPSTGGPPTYVVHGDTGVLVDPGADLGSAIRESFELVARPGRRGRARRMVEERYSVDSMAAQLTRLYRAEPALL